MQHFAPSFFRWFNARFFYKWVSYKQPTYVVGVSRLTKPFHMCGTTGVVCRRDGVHYATDRAKSQQRHLMVGKEGYPI